MDCREDIGVMYPLGVGVRVQVRASDAAMACDVLDAPPAPAPALPDDLAGPACPECGSRETDSRATLVVDDDDVAIDVAEIARSDRIRACTCHGSGHEWIDRSEALAP